MMFYVSVKREESQPISFDIVYFDPSEPSSASRRHSISDWAFIPFDERIHLSIMNVIKLARASQLVE